MKSRKDKLLQAAQNQAERTMADQKQKDAAMRQDSNMQDLVKDIADDRQVESTKTKKLPEKPDSPVKEQSSQKRSKSISNGVSQAKESDSQRVFHPKGSLGTHSELPSEKSSIYNVSSDIRLEDYTEKSPAIARGFSLTKSLLICLFVIFVIYNIYRFFTFIGASEYKLAIANNYIDNNNMSMLSDKKSVTLIPNKPIYIRFEWEDGSLKTDYLHARVDRLNANGEREEAALFGRSKPRTANYIFFAGHLEAGEYSIKITNKDGETLKTKQFTIQ